MNTNAMILVNTGKNAKLGEVLIISKVQKMINCNDCKKIDRCHTSDPNVREQLEDHPDEWCDSYQKV